MISCQEADVLAAALSVGAIDGADHAALQEHLAGCAACRRLAGEYMEAASRLPLALEPVQAPAELRSRLMKAVYAEAALLPGAAGRAAWWRRAWLRLPAGRAFTVLAGAAAAALIAVSSWAIARQGTPQTLAVSVTAMGGAPQAHGQLVMDRADREAVLTVTGLPEPAQVGGRSAVYEVWLIPVAGSPVPAAFLSLAPDGTWTAAIRGDVSSYASLAATVEPPGGSGGPTGPEVFQASLRAS